MRALARLTLTLALLVSFVFTLRTGAELASAPLAAVHADRAASGIEAVMDRALAERATPEALTTRIAARLGEDPRDWIVIDALAGLAAERGIALPGDLVQRLDTTRAADSGFIATAQACAACVMDWSACTTNLALMCRAPMDLTPVGDLAGILRAARDYMAGRPVDEVDLALSVVGVGATALVVVSGGSSAAVKAGAGLAKVARGMGRLSDGLVALTRRAVTEGVDWVALPGVRSVDDLKTAIRAEAFSPLVAVAGDLHRLNDRLGLAHSLHLMPLVEDADSARRLANAAEALDGPRLVARTELLGPARVLRATVRLSETAFGFAAALLSFAASLALAAGGVIQSAVLRHLRRRLSRPGRPRP